MEEGKKIRNDDLKWPNTLATGLLRTYVYIMYTYVTYCIHVYIFLQNPLESLGFQTICCFIFALDEVQLSLQFGFISASKLCLKINNVQTSEMVICDERIYLFTRTTPSK